MLTLAGAAGLLAVWTVGPPGGTHLGLPGVGRVRLAPGWRLMASGAATALWLLAGRLRPVRDPERWLRGAAGERATAELLSRLSARRYRVLHDRRVPGSGANLDHVVIGPSGVWVIDSKARRSPLRAGWRSASVGKRRVDVATVAWEASVVSDRLGVEARPLVVVHGRGLPRRGRRGAGVKVVPAGALLRQLRSSGRARRLCGLAPRLSREVVLDLAARCERVFAPAAGWHDAS